MNWRVGLAVGLIGVWFYCFANAGDSDAAKQRFDRINPMALAAIAFVFTEPVARERLRSRRHKKRNDDEDEDE